MGTASAALFLCKKKNQNTFLAIITAHVKRGCFGILFLQGSGGLVMESIVFKAYKNGEQVEITLEDILRLSWEYKEDKTKEAFEKMVTCRLGYLPDGLGDDSSLKQP